jgi:hypothetical protein
MVASCAPLKVSSFQDRRADFSHYRTYAWSSADRLDTGDPRLDDNHLFLERFQHDVEQQLSAKGFEKTVTGQPDLVLRYHVRIRQRLDATGAATRDGSCADCRPYLYDAGTLMIDAVDARTDQLVWRGWAEGSVEGMVDNQAFLDETLDKTIGRILERFPSRL